MKNNTHTFKENHLWRHKGFYLTLAVVFSFYQASSWFVEHWFEKRENRDTVQLERQKIAEKIAFDKVQLKIIESKEEKTFTGLPPKGLEQIFLDSANSFFSTQLLSYETKKELEDFIMFKLRHKSIPLTIGDMEQVNSGIMKLFNLYASLSMEQHPEKRKENISILKDIFSSHKENSLKIYGIDDKQYKSIFPIFDSVNATPVEIIETVFISEYKMKSEKNDYLLSIGGDALYVEFKKVSNLKNPPKLIERNVSQLNQYINNVINKGSKK